MKYQVIFGDKVINTYTNVDRAFDALHALRAHSLSKGAKPETSLQWRVVLIDEVGPRVPSVMG